MKPQMTAERDPSEEAVSRSGRTSRRPRQSRGQSIAELALTLPLLLLLLFGTVDIGRAFFSYIQMRNAAFEGARYGSKSPTDNAGITSRVNQHGVPSGTTVSVTLTGDWDEIDGDARITVVTTRTFTPFTTAFLQAFFGLDPFTIRADATMKVMT